MRMERNRREEERIREEDLNVVCRPGYASHATLQNLHLSLFLKLFVIHTVFSTRPETELNSR